MSSLPQHSLSSFRRFESDIALILDRYPKETTINPHPFSTSTYISRFRDAVNSMELNGWTSELFTLSKCNEVFRFRKFDGPFIVTHGPHKTVRIGPGRKAELTSQFIQSTSLALSGSTTFDAADEELFSAIVALKERELLSSNVSFHNLTPSQLERLENSPVIAFDEESPGVYILL